MSRRWKGRLFSAFMVTCLAVSFGTLGWLLVDTVVNGWPALDGKLFSNPPSTLPEEAGARPAILATVYLAVLLLAMTVPIGVATALYLEEYAHKERWYNRLLELNIQNLAAVPAIVYGILGLAFVVRGPVGIGRVLLAGAIILTLVVLPTVIISSREAIRAVPDSIRQGGYALGATKWRVVSRQVLPAAVPGNRDRVDPRALARGRGDGAACCSSARCSTSPSTRRSSAPSRRFRYRSTRG